MTRPRHRPAGISFTRLLVLAAALCSRSVAGGADAAPPWAYPVNPPGTPSAADDATTRHVPDSAVAFTGSELALRAGAPVPDWHPDEHPPMPDVVSKGREPLTYACGYCHLPSGAGRPENASLAGLTPAYIQQQMTAFRTNKRPGSEPQRLPQNVMIAVAKAATDAEVRDAAGYFAALKPTSFVTVIESATVPKTVVAGWTLAVAPEGGTEPIGSRIIEMPEDFARFENRDSRTPYLAYVPEGSLVRGERLVTKGGGKTLACGVCHGPTMKGRADFPHLAGRSPSYLFRQMFDFRNGTRSGAASVQMKPVVARLTDDDMIAISAYLASLEP